MDKKRIAIYPFSEECMVFSDHINMISNNLEFVHAASPVIWGISGRVIDTSYGKYSVKKSPSEFDSEVDILLIPEFQISERAEKGIISEICSYIPSVNEIVYYGKLSEKSKRVIMDYCEKSNCRFTDKRNNDSYEEIIDEQELIIPTVPIVAVSGLWEDTGKFDILLSLTDKFRKEGYKVSVIGSRGYSDFFDAKSFPVFMLDDKISQSKKIIKFNRMISVMAAEDDPDIIFIGVPGSIQPLNEKYTNGFGMTPFTAFQSFIPDYMIVSSFFEKDSAEYLEDVINLCKYRLGCSPDVFHMSNMYIDIAESDEKGKAMSHIVSKEYVDEALRKHCDISGTPLLDLNKKENINVLYDMIIEKLTGKTHVVA